MFNRRQKIFMWAMIVIILITCIVIGINLHECKENMSIIEALDPINTNNSIEASVEPSAEIVATPNPKDTIELQQEPIVSEELEQEDIEETTEPEHVEESPNIAITVEPIPDIEVDIEYIEIEDLLD